MGSNSSSNNGSNDTQVSGYEREIEKQKAKAKAKSKVTDGTLADPREKDDTAAKMDLFKNQGAINIDNLKTPPSVSILKGPLKAGSRFNRDYFKNEVLGKGAYKGTSVKDFESMSRSAQESLYGDYMSGRTSGKTDAYGREINQTDRGGNGGGAIGTSGQVVQAPTVTAPTTAEVSQSSATDAEESLVLRKRKTLARGRSPTIMTGVTGATGSLTLGKPSLLGR